ncbi:hypothetical protein acdb102_14650 [Acidothermaceae bacterium B102]|nr:hypothetical protein acdb102_14650 [Acidothermaceae bacterium B102]
MPAVYPRARFRLSAVAIALSVSSSLTLGLTSAPAQASERTAPATTSTAQLTGASVGAFSLHSIAAAGLPTVAVRHTPATKPVQKSGHQLAHEKAVAKATIVAKKAAAKKATARRVAAHRAAVKAAAAHQRAVFGARVIRAASQYRGTPYSYGATGPSRFDCSGFTRFIFAKFGISLPHSSSGQYSVVRHIASSQKRIGDLVFFHSGSGHVYHVGIYAGGDEIWAATHTGDFVRLEGMWNASYYVGRIS